MTHIIKVPTVYSCKLPDGEWINLALVRRLQYEQREISIVRLTWDNGDTEIYRNEDALAILTAWEEAHTICRQRLQELGV